MSITYFGRTETNGWTWDERQVEFAVNVNAKVVRALDMSEAYATCNYQWWEATETGRPPDGYDAWNPVGATDSAVHHEHGRYEARQWVENQFTMMAHPRGDLEYYSANGTLTDGPKIGGYKWQAWPVDKLLIAVSAESGCKQCASFGVLIRLDYGVWPFDVKYRGPIELTPAQLASIRPPALQKYGIAAGGVDVSSYFHDQGWLGPVQLLQQK
jgi:hypothetical protein